MDPDFGFAPKFPFPCPTATRYQHVVKPRPSLLTQLSKSLKTEPPFPVVSYPERSQRNKAASKKFPFFNDDNDESPDISNDDPNSNRKSSKYTVPFLKEEYDDDSDDVADTLRFVNKKVSPWEKAPSTNREPPPPIPACHKRQQRNQNGRTQVSLDDQKAQKQQKQFYKPQRMDTQLQRKVINQSKSQTKVRESKQDSVTDMSTNRTTDPKEFMLQFKNQEKVVKKQERLQGLMQLHQKQLEKQLEDYDKQTQKKRDTSIWREILPSDMNRYQFAGTRYTSMRSPPRSAWSKRRKFDYPEYTPFNDKTDNADIRAQSQHSHKAEKEEHMSAAHAYHRNRAAEMDLERSHQGSNKESAIYRLCSKSNLKSGKNYATQKSLRFNGWDKKQF